MPAPTPTTVPTETTSPKATDPPPATQTAAPSATPQPSSAICSPLAEHDLARITTYISNPYVEPITSNLEMGHHGVDFSYYRKDGVGGPIDGTWVQAMLGGRVAGLGFDRLPYGNMVVIETVYEELPEGVAELFAVQPGQSLYMLYAHMLENPFFVMSEPVDCGQAMGQVGNTGFSGNPHLHLETRVGPSGIDLPTMIFYDTRATAEEQAAYVEWRTGSTWTKHDPTQLLLFAQAWAGGNP